MTKVADLSSNASATGSYNTALNNFSDTDTGDSGSTFAGSNAGSTLVASGVSGDSTPATYSDIALNQGNTTLANASTGSGSVPANDTLSSLTTADADWKGDEAIGVAQLTDSIPTANAKMYAQVDAELDAIFGKGQYTKPEGHYQYVKKIGEAMKLLSPEQQVAFKNRLEKIGQPLHINFGLTRTRKEGSITYGIPLNSYAQNPFSSAQQVEEMRLKKEFFDQRDAALGRTVAR
jgi:hypothetical protein